MITGQWLLGLVIGGLAVNALFAYYAHRSFRRLREAPDSEVSTHEDDVAATDDSGVTCLHWGTENEPEYRFCRSCVSELPGTGGYGRRENGQLGRVSL